MKNTYEYADGVKKWMKIGSIFIFLVIVTIPLAIYLLVKSSRARLEFDDNGFTVSGLGLTSSRWDYDDLQRIGLYRVKVNGGGPMVAMNGGRVATNLVGKTKAGKQKKFMLSRFEEWQEILDRIESETGLPLEDVRQGMMGLKFPEAKA